MTCPLGHETHPTHTKAIHLQASYEALDEMLDRVPDEFYEWVRETKADLLAQHHSIKEAALNEFVGIRDLKGRKAFAAEACKRPNRALLFRLYDGREVDSLIWKMIQPAYERPFRQDDAA